MAKKHINIITLNQLLSPGNRTKGGLELVGYEMSKLMQDMGYDVVFYQNSFSNDYWEDMFEGAKVRAFPGGPGCPPQHIYNTMGENVLYLWWGAATDYPIPGIFYAHGIHYNDPATNGYAFDGIRPWIKKAFERNKFGVFVDSSELNLVRAVMPDVSFSKSTFIVNFADINRFKPVKKKSDGFIHVLYPRRIDHVRGINVMKTLVPKFLNKYPNVVFDFVVDQNHPETYAELENWARSQQHRNRVTVGTLMYTEMEKAYQKADIVMAPTLYCEGSSLTVVEAVCSGVPVVSSNIGGIPDVLINGFNGLVTDPTQENFESSLSTLIEDENLRLKFGKNGASMREAFSLDRWRHAWSKLIERFY